MKSLEKLTEGLFVIPPLPQLAVWHKETQEILLKEGDEDFEKKLIELSDRDDICIDRYYWNYKYNNYGQLCDRFKEYIKDQIDALMGEITLASYGLFLNHILFHEILVNAYQVDVETFSNLLDNINIDRNVISKLLIHYHYKLPFTYNYYLLIKRVFCNYKILDLIFHPQDKSVHFTCSQITEILSEIDFGDINGAYYKITSHKNYTLEEKLQYIKCLLEAFEGHINQENTLYYSVKNPKFFLGIYLFSLDIEGSLTNLYYQVIDLYLSKHGARKIIVIDDVELNNKINQKLI